jgi:hypothetical protein
VLSQFKNKLKNKTNIFFLILLATFIILSISRKVHRERSLTIYAKLLNEKKKKYLDLSNQTCYEDSCYTASLNDKVINYLEESYLNGTKKFLEHKKDIYHLVASEHLVEIEANEYCMLDTMYYSYPFLTPETKVLIEEIGERFHRKLENTSLECSRFTLTSMLRTTNSISRLRKRNRNAIKNSAHLHGTTFDISYKQFWGKKKYSFAEILYLQDVLAKTISELRDEKRCFATYEQWQTCFHVVCR